MKKSLSNSGERLIPEYHQKSLIYGEHIARYRLAQKIVKNKVVLDVASGSGYGSKMLSEEAKMVYGVDISIDAVEYAKENFSTKNTQFICASADKIPLKDNSVDIVVSFETLEHIDKNQNDFIQEIKRVLSENGELIISTPNDRVVPPGNHFHVHELSQKEFTVLLKKHFKFVELYFQTVSLASVIASGTSFSKNKPIIVETEKTYEIPDKDSTYFIAQCSQNRINRKESPYVVLSENWMHIDQKNNFDNLQDLRAKLEDSVQTINKLKNQNIEFREKLDRFNNSLPGKIYRKVRQIKK